MGKEHLCARGIKIPDEFMLDLDDPDVQAFIEMTHALNWPRVPRGLESTTKMDENEN